MVEKCVEYNVHHNWEWVISEALVTCDYFRNSNKNISKSIKRERMRDLPSQFNIKTKPSYALFRIECNSTTVWCTSNAFTHLDSKDYLYSQLLKRKKENFMPFTQLLDCNLKEDEIPNLPSLPSLLKAACGSGGFGIYKVFCKNDVLKITQFHQNHSQKHDGFIDSLKLQNNGRLPQWSLQSFLPTIKVLNNRKPQIRSYICVCDHYLYLYRDLEVRLPYWNEDLAEEFNYFNGNTITLYETECCADTSAVPYNKCRRKEKTERYMLDEIHEIAYMKDEIFNVMREALIALQPSITATINSNNDNSAKYNEGLITNHCNMAVAGVDIILHDISSSLDFNNHDVNSSDEEISRPKLVPKILELNNNPAMPSVDKKMSDMYKRHLVSFVGNLISLGLFVAEGTDYLNSKFECVSNQI